MWNKVELLINDDNTFRLCNGSAQQGSALYQVDTLVKVSSENVVSNSKLGLYASLTSTNCIVVCDTTVVLFDPSFQTVLLHLYFDTSVDAVCSEGNFLLIGERNGNLHLIYVPQQKIIMTKALQHAPSNGEESTYKSLILQEISDSPGIFLLFLTVQDGVLIISGLDLGKAQKAIDSMDLSTLSELQGLIRMDFCATKEIHDGGCLCTVTGDLDNRMQLLVGGKGENSLSQWEMNQSQGSLLPIAALDSTLIPGVRKIQVMDNIIYVLNEEGMLSVWDVHSLVMLCCWPDLTIEDFLLITEGDSASITSQDSAKIVTLGTADEKQMRSLMVQSLPSMAIMYSLEVSGVSCLVQSGMNMDTIYLLEGVAEDSKGSGSAASAIVMRCFTEALPENRFNRLLYKHKFEEAEQFALTFGLDIEAVYKVKLNAIGGKLACYPCSQPDQTRGSDLIEEAKTNLKKITDEQYVVQYCLTALWPTMDVVEEMLGYAAARFPSVEIQMALAKLATFSSIYGPDSFKGALWIEFLNSDDYLCYIYGLLRSGNISGAQHLWLRHEGEFVQQFDEDALQCLLASIPLTVPSRELCLWFKAVVVPFVWKVLPKGQKILARWLEQRARNLELTEKSDWPHNGLKLAELGLPSCMSIPLEESSGVEEMELLKTLVVNLRHLCDLYVKYNCKLRLSDFEMSNTRSMAFLMLDKVLAPELISSVIENSIHPYALEHNLDLNTTLLLYIKDLSDSCSSQTTALFSEWEDKAVAILRCMTNTDLMMDAVLAIMFKAVVPWSETVECLVQQHLEKEHPKQELLKESYRCMETKKLLSRYGVRNLSHATDDMMVVRHILKQNLPTSLEDALCLAKAYQLNPSEIHFHYILQHLETIKMDEIVSLLKRMAPAEAKVTICRLSSWATMFLSDKKHISEEHKKKKMLVTNMAVEVLGFLQCLQKVENSAMQAECQDDLQRFMTIAHLQEDFDVFLTPNELDDPKVRKLFEERVCKAYESTKAVKRFASSSHVEDIHQAKAAHDPGAKSKGLEGGVYSSATFTEASLCRLARRLKLTEQELWADMAHRALEAGKVEKVLKILRELYQQYPNSSTGEVLFSVAQQLCQNLRDDVHMILPERINLPAVIHQLACQALAVCSSDLVLDCLELSKNTQRAADVYCQSQIDDNYGFVAKDSKPDGEQEDRLESGMKDFFIEDGIVLDPLIVLPLQYKITTCFMPLFSDSKIYPLESCSLAYCTLGEGEDHLGPTLSPLVSMLQSLQESSQLQLGLGLLLDSYMAILHHVASCTTVAAATDVGDKHNDEKWLAKVKERVAVVRQTALSALNVIVVSLLQKVLNWKLVDFELAIGLSTILPKTKVLAILWKIITNAWQNYDKIADVARVGAHICFIYEDEQERQKFLPVITDAEWGSKLGKLGVSIQSVFRQCPETKRNLIPVLVKNRNITPEIILQYCSTYGLDGEQAINLLITTLLLQEDGEAAEDGAGDAVADSAAVDPLERALQVLPQLRSTRDLFVSLNAVVPKLSPYNYEKIERILTTLEAANESTTLFPLSQMTGLLHHLKSYRRISPPTDLESTFLFENSFELTPLASTRLPFHMLLQTNRFFWKIIAPELSEETFPTLLLICKLMKVSVDKLYMLVVTHVFEKRLKPMIIERAKRGQTHTQNEKTDVVVKAIFDYTLCIQNLELAAATIHKIAQELPAGTEKTAFLKFCLELGHKLLKSESLEDQVRVQGEAVVSKMQQQYQRSAIENMVMSSQLSSPELLKLTGQPGRLIVALFEHSSVEERMKNPAGQTYPDIHAIVKEIATISRVDIVVARNFLLEKWLCKIDSSSPKDLTHQDYVTDLQSDPDMMRYCNNYNNYEWSISLRMHPMDMSARLLCSILTAESWPLGGSGSRLTFEHRSRALYCLSHIADGATLESLLQIPKTKVKQYTQCYVYLSQLEKLNIPYTLELFLSSPKEGLIKGLWKNHSHEPEAVRLVADLALEYHIHDPQLWNGILQKLVAFNMTSYLQKLLEAIGAIPSLWEVPSLLRTWRSVILTPFMTASVPLSPEQQATFYKTFLLILKCPFLLNLDLIGIAKRFAQFSMPGYSLGTLLLVPCAKKREQQIQCFLSSCDPVLILDQVKTHMCTGELAGVPSLVMGTVFTQLCQKRQYDRLVKTEHFQDFKQHLVLKSQPDQVKDLVDYLINHHREQDAVSLAKVYLKSLEHKVGKQASHADPVKEHMQRTLDSLGGQKDM